MAPSRVPWVLILLFAGDALAAPNISYPLNAQVPPVARVDAPFSFVFSSNTFTSISAVSYSLRNAPSWLSLDSAERRFYGTPGEQDIGPGLVVGVPIELVATDSSGSTMMNSTLVVSRDPSPTIQLPLAEQIQNLGAVSPPSSILLYPNTPYNFTFANDTFVAPSSQPLNYYAVTADNTPLPAWIQFDAGTLTFSGSTPPFETLVGPPEQFNLVLVASDVTGFSAASIPFSVIVGQHKLTVDEPSVTLNAMPGTQLSYTGLKSIVKIDGNPAAPTNLSGATASDMPPWLTLDNITWDLNGATPSDAQSSSFPITITDNFGDSLNVTIQVAVGNSLFVNTFPTLNLKQGEAFSFNFESNLIDPSNIDVTISTSPASDWIHYNPAAVAISGVVPNNGSVPQVAIIIQAKDKTSGQTSLKTFDMEILSATTSSVQPTVTQFSPVAPTATPIAKPTATQPGSPSSGDGGSGTFHNTVLLAVLLPLLSILTAVIFILLYCYRKRRNRTRPRTSKSDISRPVSPESIDNPAAEADMKRNYEMEEGRRGYQRGHHRGPSFFSIRSFRRLTRTEHETEPMPSMPSQPGTVIVRRGTGSGGDDMSEGGESWVTEGDSPHQASRPWVAVPRVNGSRTNLDEGRYAQSVRGSMGILADATSGSFQSMDVNVATTNALPTAPSTSQTSRGSHRPTRFAPLGRYFSSGQHSRPAQPKPQYRFAAPSPGPEGRSSPVRDWASPGRVMKFVKGLTRKKSQLSMVTVDTRELAAIEAEGQSPSVAQAVPMGRPSLVHVTDPGSNSSRPTRPERPRGPDSNTWLASDAVTGSNSHPHGSPASQYSAALSSHPRHAALGSTSSQRQQTGLNSHPPAPIQSATAPVIRVSNAIDEPPEALMPRSHSGTERNLTQGAFKKTGTATTTTGATTTTLPSSSSRGVLQERPVNQVMGHRVQPSQTWSSLGSKATNGKTGGSAEPNWTVYPPEASTPSVKVWEDDSRGVGGAPASKYNKYGYGAGHTFGSGSKGSNTIGVAKGHPGRTRGQENGSLHYGSWDGSECSISTEEENDFVVFI